MIRRRQHQHGVHGHWRSNQRMGSAQNPISVTATPAYSNAKSILFDGSDEYLTATVVADSPIKSISTAATIAAWFKSSASGNEVILAFGKSTARSMFIGHRTGVAWFDITSSTGRLISTNGSGYNDGNWHHFAATWNGSTMTTYIDGSSVGTGSRDGELNDGANVFDLIRVGRAHAHYGDYFTGNIDEAAIWNVALSAADITAIRNSGEPNDLLNAASYDTDRTGNLAGWWRCGDGDSDSNTTIYDLSGIDNATNLTGTNLESGDLEEDVPS